ncbi:MAG: helix-turn-helix transcriptional regulator [Ignavibacteriaceae bacterium]
MCILYPDRCNSRMGIPALPICKVTLKAKKPISKAYPMTLKTIGDHIRKRRVELKLFQKDVAHILGVKKESIYNWEKNHNSPKIYLLPKIIKFLGYVPFDLPKETIGDKVIAYRKEHGLSQRKLAELLSVDQSTIRDWENNKHKPSKKLFKSINKILV